VNDAVDRVIVEREAMDRGLAGGVVLSLGAHALLLGSAVFVAILAPKEPLLKVVDGFAVALPPGGGGSPTAQVPAPGQTNPEPPKPEATLPPKPEPQKVIKPPKEEKPKGLPDVDARTAKKKVEKSQRPEVRSTGTADSSGTSAQTPGVSFGPVGPGVPGGTDPNGDWYLAGVQRKIWMLWSQQIHAGSWQPFTVSFTIMADGSVNDVKVVQGSGVFTLDLAAQRAISSAAPFGPLPKNYGTDRYTIQALFKPTS
jgi:TonB family protein